MRLKLSFHDVSCLSLYHMLTFSIWKVGFKPEYVRNHVLHRFSSHQWQSSFHDVHYRSRYHSIMLLNLKSVFVLQSHRSLGFFDHVNEYPLSRFSGPPSQRPSSHPWNKWKISTNYELRLLLLLYRFHYTNSEFAIKQAYGLGLFFPGLKITFHQVVPVCAY